MRLTSTHAHEKMLHPCHQLLNMGNGNTGLDRKSAPSLLLKVPPLLSGIKVV